MTRNEFRSCIALLVGAVGKPMPDEMLESWFLILGDMNVEELRQGIVTTLKTHEYGGFPAVGLIRKNAGANGGQVSIPDRCSVAWSAIKTAIAQHGGYRTVSFDDPMINAAIRSMGGWERFCECESGEQFDVWLRKEFEAMYGSLLRVGVAASQTTPLPGLCDKSNSAEGHEERVEVAKIETNLPAVPARLIKGELPKIEHREVKRLAENLVPSLELPPEPPKVVHPPKSAEQQKAEAIAAGLLSHATVDAEMELSSVN